MAIDLDDVRALLPDVDLSHLEPVGGGERSDVARVRARWPGQDPTSLIVKQFHHAGEGWARECAALQTIDGRARTARLVAFSADPPIAVLSDLGPGRSVAADLLGDDPSAAGDAVSKWAAAIAALHRCTLQSRAAFRGALGERVGDLPVTHAPLAQGMREATDRLAEYCGRLDVSVPAGALREVRDLPTGLLGPDGPAALSPSDACPDNNVVVDEVTYLVDFEGAAWRHVAWDVAYLTVPWPTCWCSWRMPGEVSEHAFETYRAGMEDVLPYVRTQEFRRDVAAAALGWSFLSTALFLDGALGDDLPAQRPDRPTPTRRALILHRLDGARRNEQLPAAAELAVRLRDVLVERWGEVRLGYAPAFAERA